MGSCTWRFGRLLGGISSYCPLSRNTSVCTCIIAPTSIAETGALPDTNNKWLNSPDAVHFACVFEGLCLRSAGSVSADVASVHKKESPLCVRVLCSLMWQTEAFTANTEQVPGRTSVSLTSCHSPVDGFFDDLYLPVTGLFPAPTAKKVALRLDAMVFY